MEFEAGKDVYLPSDDSLLLSEFVPRFSRGDVLDVGTGCGVQAVIAAKKAKSVLAIDVNPSALSCAKENALLNKLQKKISFRESDLFSAIKWNETFDLIIFNPPYLPTSPAERVQGPLNAAFDGGPDGRMVIDRFLGEFFSHLKLNGDVLLLHCHLADTAKTVFSLSEIGLEVETLKTIKAGNEELSVIHAKRVR